MMAHPGKKLLFMGQEFAQENEWNEKQELPWEQAEEPDHRALQQYVKALNTFYQEHPAWYETDFDAEGFEWLSSMDADHSIITFMRYDAKKEERLLVVCNFTPVTYENFKIGVPVAGNIRKFLIAIKFPLVEQVALTQGKRVRRRYLGMAGSIR